MGGADRCAVFGCDNERRYPERYVIKEHVQTLRFHACRNKKHFAKWTRLLNLAGYRVSATTRICSNHFKYGQPFPIDPHPSLFLKGYQHQTSKKQRKSPMKRPLNWKVGLKPKCNKFMSVGLQANAEEIDAEVNLAFQNDHNYLFQECPKQHFSADYVALLEEELHKLSKVIEDLKTNLKDAQTKIKDLESKISHKFCIEGISHSDDLVKLYTGLPSYKLFQWLVEEVRPHAQVMHYYRGRSSTEPRNYQLKSTKKPGPKRSLSIENELLITLIKLRLNLSEEDLAFRFGIPQSVISQVISTWIPFLAKELAPLIYWPSRQDILMYYPKCFRQYEGTVRCILDCTEMQIDRPSLAGTNSQVYSQYKSRHTMKCLVGITPGGTISFISKPTGGNTSDKQIVKMTNIVDKFDQDDIVLADRGFNVQGLFLGKNVRIIIPPFTRTTKSTSQFTEEEDAKTKTVANARIHVERAIGRLKAFKIMQGPIPLTMIDLLESSLVVCAAIVNLQPLLVPLSS